MRALPTALIVAAILTAGAAFAQGMSEDMKGMPGMQHPAHAAITGHGIGVITAIDINAAKVTIKHGPIPAVNWPAMTMTFKATPPALLLGLHVGQRVKFNLTAQGMAAEVTAIKPQ